MGINFDNIPLLLTKSDNWIIYKYTDEVGEIQPIEFTEDEDGAIYERPIHNINTCKRLDWTNIIFYFSNYPIAESHGIAFVNDYEFTRLVLPASDYVKNYLLGFLGSYTQINNNGGYDVLFYGAFDTDKYKNGDYEIYNSGLIPITGVNVQGLSGVSVDIDKAKGFYKTFITEEEERAESVPMVAGTPPPAPASRDNSNIIEVSAIDDSIKNIMDVQAKHRAIYESKFLMRGLNGEILATIKNLDYLISANGLLLRFNQLKKEIEINGLEDLQEFNRCENMADFLTILKDFLYINYNAKYTDRDLKNYVTVLANKKAYSPVFEWFEEIKGGYTPADEEEFIKLVNAITIDSNFIKYRSFFEKLIYKWFLGCVKVGYNANITDDKRLNTSEGILILKGGQGIGKTRFIKSLVPFGEWVKIGSYLNTNNNDSIRENTNYFIVELAEINKSLKPSYIDGFKMFINRPIDEYRAPYDITARKYKRLTAFYGSVNDDEFLKDDTGERRFWVVPVEKINLELLNSIDLKKLWRFFIHLSNKIPHYLDNEEIKTLEEINARFKVKSNTDILILDLLNWSVDVKYWRIVSPTMLVNEIKALGFPAVSSRSLGWALSRLIKSNTDPIYSHIEKIRVGAGFKYKLPPLIGAEIKEVDN